MVDGPLLPPGRPVELPGRGTTFVREIQGPPGAPTLLLLHGWTAGSDLTWFACFEELGRHFRVVTIDHRGHGRGLRTPARFSLEDCAGDAAALLHELDLEAGAPVLAVGYSMGGCIGQLLWRQQREALDGLVLCSTSAVFTESPVERRYFAALGGLALASRLTPAPLRRRLARRVLGRRVADCSLQAWILDELHRNDPTAVLEAGQALGRFDSREWVGEIDVPTAVVVTTADRQVLPRRQHALARALPDTTVHEVEAGHDACVSAPERFVPALVAACRSVAERSSQMAAMERHSAS
ncbi:MAG: alpha/beta hydrolase [Actinomycetota bacterium]|jgi:pimeloyl-ACP methyl ester carboxylesterase|nr:alpha/beta hydrolase [Actinomycetota bacterium]